jgi:hypothetical protein
MTPNSRTEKPLISETYEVVRDGVKAVDKHVIEPAAEAAFRASCAVGNHFLEAAANVVAERARGAIESTISYGLERCFGSDEGRKAEIKQDVKAGDGRDTKRVK